MIYPTSPSVRRNPNLSVSLKPLPEKLSHSTRWRRSLWFSLLLLMLLLEGCTTNKSITNVAPTTSNAKPKIVATTGMIADLVRQIGADRIELSQLINAGVDPHLYRPTRDDVSEIRSARLVFFNGFKLEGRMGDLLSRQSSPSQRFVALADSIPADSIIGDIGHEAADPHVWMDVSLWSLTTSTIESELTKILPQYADEFSQRTQRIQSRLAELDANGKKWIATIPPPKRVLITSHDAFRYFGRRYGLQVEGIQGISTVSEAGLKRINELVDMIVSGGIPAAFVESSVPKDSIEAVIAGAASRGSPIVIGGELYSDAMGPTGSDAESYEGMLLHNFQTVVKALGGTTE